MSILTNEKVKAHLAVVNSKVNDVDLNGPDFFSEVFKTDDQDNLTFPSQVLTTKTYKIDEEITFEKVRDKICADPAMAALMKKTEEKYADNTVTVKMRNPINKTIEQLIEEKREIDKLVAELFPGLYKSMDELFPEAYALSPEVQTLMAEAFRRANKELDRNRNRGRGHQE